MSDALTIAFQWHLVSSTDILLRRFLREIFKMPSERFSCPCCGYFTFKSKPPGTYDICEICFWEDIKTDSHWPKSYFNTLIDAQRMFADIGACSEEFVGNTRRPSIADKRVENWRTLETRIADEKTELLKDIVDAFRYVTREDGVTIHEAEVIDNYGSDAQRRKARSLDTEKSWQGIPKEVLRSLFGFSFLDSKGFRYYVPAYMTFSIENSTKGGYNSIDFLILSIESLAEAKRSQFTTKQCHVMTRFLFYMECFVNRSKESDKYAEQLKRRWGSNWDDSIVERFRY